MRLYNFYVSLYNFILYCILIFFQNHELFQELRTRVKSVSHHFEYGQTCPNLKMNVKKTHAVNLDYYSLVGSMLLYLSFVF